MPKTRGEVIAEDEMRRREHQHAGDLEAARLEKIMVPIMRLNSFGSNPPRSSLASKKCAFKS
jgi:hypothetical protein